MISLERLYGKSPIAIQNLMVAAQGGLFRYRRSDDVVWREQLQWLLRTEKWEEERFAAYQDEQIASLVDHAVQHVPHYRDVARSLGFQAGDLKSVGDLSRLPILEKAEVRGNELRFVDERMDPSRCNEGFTSGTTGTPMRTFSNREAFAKRFSFVARLRTWAGVEPFYPKRAQFTGRDIVPATQPKDTHVYWRSNPFGRSLLFSTSHISPETGLAYVRRLAKLQPELIDGYPSAIATTARLAEAAGWELPTPKAIITTAETLLPADRDVIERAFQTRVFDQYAASEPSCFWCDCEYGRMHINPEYGVSEIVDEHANPSDVGSVVVTSFLNPIMPLIRYRVGDLAERSDEECPCGRSMPVVARVLGRQDDILYIPGQGLVGRLDPVFKKLQGIAEAQIVQEALDSIRVHVVEAGNSDGSWQAPLLDNLRAKIGMNVYVKIKIVNHIERGPNGKFKSVISRVRDQYPDAIKDALSNSSCCDVDLGGKYY